MKKFFSLMVACAALFAACETDTTGNDVNNNGGNNNNGGENNGKKEALATPTLEVKDLTSTSFTVTWAAVENAESYMVTVGDAQPVTITETSYALENLNAGTYTGSVIAVAGKDSKYTNSKAATFSQAVTGLTAEECDWVDCMASLPTEEDAEYGYFPFMHIFHSFKGTGIIEIKNGAFLAETYKDTPLADLAKECDALDAEVVAAANGEGVTVVFSGIQAETEYRVVAAITNEAGLTVIFEQNITTTEAQPHPAVEAFAGTWTVTTEEALIIPLAEEDPIRVEAQTLSTTATVTHAPELSFNAVFVAGLSTLFPEVPAVGIVGNDKEGNPVLQILNGEVVSVTEDQQYYIGFGTISEVTLPDGSTQYGPVGGSYPSFTIINGKGSTYAGELNGGGTFETMAMAVAAYDESLTLVGWYFDTEADTVLMSGEQTWTRTSEDNTEDNTEENVPATFSKGLNIRKATAVNMPSYVAL